MGKSNWVLAGAWVSSDGKLEPMAGKCGKNRRLLENALEKVKLDPLCDVIVLKRQRWKQTVAKSIVFSGIERRPLRYWTRTRCIRERDT